MSVLRMAFLSQILHSSVLLSGHCSVVQRRFGLDDHQLGLQLGPAGLLPLR